MDLGLRDRVAVITGGGSGIGLSTARLLLDEGARVAICDQYAERLATVEASLAGGARMLAVVADLSKISEAERLREIVSASFGPAEILVNAAGVTGATGSFHDLTDEDWIDTLNIDFMVAVRVCRAFIPGMRTMGWGRIVLVSSEDAVQPYADELPYCAGKAAVLNLSKGLSKAYASDGILVNAVMPAFIRTPMTDAMMANRAETNCTSINEAVASFLKEERPTLELKRRGEAQEVAAAIGFLCSAQASFINGASLRVDGGSVATI